MLKYNYILNFRQIMTISKAVTTRINELLVQKNMSWYKLEQDSLLSKGTIVCVQYSKYKSVNLSTLITIIRTLNISIPEFFDSPLFSEDNLDIEN